MPARGIAGCGVDDQAGRFVQHQQIVIGVNDVQLDTLGEDFIAAFRFRIQVEQLASAQAVGRLRGDPVHGQRTSPDPFLQPGAGEIRKKIGSRLIQSHSGMAGIGPGGHPDSVGKAWHPRLRPLLRNGLLFFHKCGRASLLLLPRFRYHSALMLFTR